MMFHCWSAGFVVGYSPDVLGQAGVYPARLVRGGYLDAAPAISGYGEGGVAEVGQAAWPARCRGALHLVTEIDVVPVGVYPGIGLPHGFDLPHGGRVP